MDRFVPRDDDNPSLRGRAHIRHCEAEGRGNPWLPTTAAWIASFLAMTEKASLRGRAHIRHCEAAPTSVIARPKAVAIHG
jgi:hypothetical protein